MRTFLTVLLAFALLAIPSFASADIAPPAMPPGSNPVPGSETTQVRMLAETVSLDILPSAPKGSLGRAKVTASFTMRNLGEKPEQMAVRFPVGVADERSGNPSITDMQVKVDGQMCDLTQVFPVKTLILVVEMYPGSSLTPHSHQARMFQSR